MFERNLKKLKELAQERGLSNLVLVGEANITYATGLWRPAGALVVSESCGDVMLVPLFDYFRVIAKVPKEVEVKAVAREGEPRGWVPERDVIPGTLVEAIAKVVERCPGKVGLDAAWGAAWGAVGTVKALEQRLGAEDVSEQIDKLR
ncbi:MAG: aminopeptidase P family N-terminal domain-containing protein, partial [Acidilobaceae archaeon]|nr:aminopeptidase P family N-terminal domain-containing protein [Acidilobaceae archaeon]